MHRLDLLSVCYVRELVLCVFQYCSCLCYFGFKFIKIRKYFKGLVAMLTYHLIAQFHHCYLACFKPLGFPTFSCSLIVREHMFSCAITATVSVLTSVPHMQLMVKNKQYDTVPKLWKNNSVAESYQHIILSRYNDQHFFHPPQTMTKNKEHNTLLHQQP